MNSTNSDLAGDGIAPNPSGLLTQLADAATTPSAVADFGAFSQLSSDGIDGGPWSESMMQVMLLVNVDAMRLAERTFQTTASYAGELSAAAYLRQNSGGIYSSRRMPATATTIATAIRYRSGTMGLDGVDAVRTAVCPMWNELQIDDIYSDAASGIRHFTMHNLIGDVLVEQPNAYEKIAIKVA